MGKGLYPTQLVALLSTHYVASGTRQAKAGPDMA